MYRYLQTTFIICDYNINDLQDMLVLIKLEHLYSVFSNNNNSNNNSNNNNSTSNNKRAERYLQTTFIICDYSINDPQDMYILFLVIITTVIIIAITIIINVQR